MRLRGSERSRERTKTDGRAGLTAVWRLCEAFSARILTLNKPRATCRAASSSMPLRGRWRGKQRAEIAQNGDGRDARFQGCGGGINGNKRRLISRGRGSGSPGCRCTQLDPRPGSGPFPSPTRRLRAECVGRESDAGRRSSRLVQQALTDHDASRHPLQRILRCDCDHSRSCHSRGHSNRHFYLCVSD